jgi:hypothetical protein
MVIQSRFYNVQGTKWEARFFSKGETFPETDLRVSRQGIWARRTDSTGWENSVFVASSWSLIQMTPDILYLTS